MKGIRIGFIRNVAWTFAGSVLTFLIGLVTSIIVAWSLGPIGKGILSLVLLIPSTIFMITHLGVGNANIYFLNSKKTNFQSITSVNIFLFFTMSAISTALYIIIPWFFRHKLLQQIPLSLIIFAGFIIPLSFFNNYFGSFLQAYRWMKENSIISVSTSLINLILLIIGVYILHLSVMGALLASVLSSFLGCFLTVRYVKKLGWTISNVFKEKLFGTESLSLAKNLLAFGSRIYISGILWFFILRIDMYMVSYFSGVKGLGFYSLSVNLAENLWLISNSISAVWLPTVSAMNPKESSEFAARTVRITLWLILLLSGMLVIFAKPMIVTLYSQKFEPSIAPFRLLLGASVFFAIRSIIGQTFVGWGKPAINIYTHIIALVVNVLANLYFIPYWGIKGAALASLIAYGIDALLGIVIFLLLSGIGISKLLLLERDDIQLALNKFRVRSSE